MNQKQKLKLIGGSAAFVGFIITSRYLDKRRERRIAQEEKLREQNHKRVMKSLEALDSHLKTQLETAKFWEQVTHDL